MADKRAKLSVDFVTTGFDKVGKQLKDLTSEVKKLETSFSKVAQSLGQISQLAGSFNAVKTQASQAAQAVNQVAAATEKVGRARNARGQFVKAVPSAPANPVMLIEHGPTRPRGWNPSRMAGAEQVRHSRIRQSLGLGRGGRSPIVASRDPYQHVGVHGVYRGLAPRPFLSLPEHPAIEALNAKNAMWVARDPNLPQFSGSVGGVPVADFGDLDLAAQQLESDRSKTRAAVRALNPKRVANQQKLLNHLFGRKRKRRRMPLYASSQIHDPLWTGGLDAGLGTPDWDAADANVGAFVDEQQLLEDIRRDALGAPWGSARSRLSKARRQARGLFRRANGTPTVNLAEPPLRSFHPATSRWANRIGLAQDRDARAEARRLVLSDRMLEEPPLPPQQNALSKWTNRVFGPANQPGFMESMRAGSASGATLAAAKAGAAAAAAFFVNSRRVAWGESKDAFGSVMDMSRIGSDMAGNFSIGLGSGAGRLNAGVTTGGVLSSWARSPFGNHNFRRARSAIGGLRLAALRIGAQTGFAGPEALSMMGQAIGAGGLFGETAEARSLGAAAVKARRVFGVAPETSGSIWAGMRAGAFSGFANSGQNSSLMELGVKAEMLGLQGADRQMLFNTVAQEAQRFRTSGRRFDLTGSTNVAQLFGGAGLNSPAAWTQAGNFRAGVAGMVESGGPTSGIDLVLLRALGGAPKTGGFGLDQYQRSAAKLASGVFSEQELTSLMADFRTMGGGMNADALSYPIQRAFARYGVDIDFDTARGLASGTATMADLNAALPGNLGRELGRQASGKTEDVLATATSYANQEVRESEKLIEAMQAQQEMTLRQVQVGTRLADVMELYYNLMKSFYSFGAPISPNGPMSFSQAAP